MLTGSHTLGEEPSFRDNKIVSPNVYGENIMLITGNSFQLQRVRRKGKGSRSQSLLPTLICASSAPAHPPAAWDHSHGQVTEVTVCIIITLLTLKAIWDK